MRLLLTGATGVAGLSIYRAALSDPAVTSITLLLRRSFPEWAVLPPNATEKTQTIIHSDYVSYSPDLASSLAQHDACIWAMGKASSGMSEADYTRLTYDYPMAFIKALRDAGAGAERKKGEEFRLVYISGEMADPTQTSRQMWARVKAEPRTISLHSLITRQGLRCISCVLGTFSLQRTTQQIVQTNVELWPIMLTVPWHRYTPRYYPPFTRPLTLWLQSGSRSPRVIGRTLFYSGTNSYES
ncbi:unnamed protein product [Somion occarium]|uniref:NAD(P)-binding domain-containing protein n=1 Tax=Somion occarium TaxID=3059160 RepID=A0ABP1DLY8_9APHY